MSNCWGAWAAR